MTEYIVYTLRKGFFLIVGAWAFYALYTVIVVESSGVEVLPLWLILGVGFFLLPFIARTFFLRKVTVTLEGPSDALPERVAVAYYDFTGEEISKTMEFGVSEMKTLNVPAMGKPGMLSVKLADGRKLSLLKHHMASRGDDFEALAQAMNILADHRSIARKAHWNAVETVSFGRRLGSYLVELGLIIALLYLLGTLLDISPVWEISEMYSYNVGFILLYLGKDLTGGRSIVKRLFGIIIQDMDTGGQPGAGRLILRNILVVPGFGLFLEMIVSLFSPQRRIGDYIAGTRVIRARVDAEGEGKS